MDYVGGHADLHHSLQDRRVQPGKPHVNIKTLAAFLLTLVRAVRVLS